MAQTAHVKLNRTTLIGDTSHEAGEVIAVDHAQAEALVRSGAGSLVPPGEEGPPEEATPKPVDPAIEQATAPKPPDKATHPRQR